jgi:thiamine pyrophosphokinase
MKCQTTSSAAGGCLDFRHEGANSTGGSSSGCWWDACRRGQAASEGSPQLNDARFVIFANGSLPHPERARRLLRANDRVICANGGTHHALALDLMPSAVIGDIDSLSSADERRLVEAGVSIERHPRDKNETDLELALEQALRQDARSILIVAGLGRRLDQTLGNISLMSDPRFSLMDCRMDDGADEVFFCRSSSAIQGAAGDTVSLIPWGATVTEIYTDGLKWPLSGDSLEPHRSRGISNEMSEASASVKIGSGLLLIVHQRSQPGEPGGQRA